MRLTTRSVDAMDEDVRDDIAYLDKLCFAPNDAKIDFETPTAWWMVYDKDQPVAYGGVRRSAQWLDWGYLCRAGVDPKYRGHGLQRKLIRLRVKFARQRGWDGLITDTSCDNIRSSNNLIAEGFKLFRPLEPWSFSTSLYWMKALEAQDL